jgi:hypothetical protein
MHLKVAEDSGFPSQMYPKYKEKGCFGLTGNHYVLVSAHPEIGELVI